jgi:hypothetical protein
MDWGLEWKENVGQRGLQTLSPYVVADLLRAKLAFDEKYLRRHDPA